MMTRRAREKGLRENAALRFTVAAAVAFGACSDPDTLQVGGAALLPDGGGETAIVDAALPPIAPGVVPSSRCGDGHVDPGELCDGTPGCNVSCGLEVLPGRCGDGKATAPEECDDGNLADGDSCSRACLLIDCGNGRVDPGETCDRTDSTCVGCQTVPPPPPPPPASCGNGTKEGPEECDDGNLSSGDRCSAECLSEGCGNLRLDAQETCDPPDALSCNDECQRVTCGDGRKEGIEGCDDGNVERGDRCDDQCQVECGNGRLDPNEDCEPPGTMTCDASCRAVRVDCGDGKRHLGEECDDGNMVFGDGCSPSCQRESCSNGRVEAPAEECEPPGTSSCTLRCRRPRCGDGELTRPGEECEDGNLDNGDGCSSSCRLEVCGNGVLDAPEQCEPPGTATCDERCRLKSQPGLELRLGAAEFRLRNPGFDGTLEPWSSIQSAPVDAVFNSIDADGSLTSGSVQLGGQSGVAQCVRTAPGAGYRLIVAATAVERSLVAQVQLRARFHDDLACTGRMLDGVTALHTVTAAGWSAPSLPPAAMVPGQPSSFTAPAGARSMAVSLELVHDASDEPSTVLLDRAELVRASPTRCGDGIPEGAEECESSSSPACAANCQLTRACGDGVAAPGECGPGGTCVSDCPPTGAVCGDGHVTPPEECDPPAAPACSARCTVLRGACGDRKVDPGEQCDPPDGWACSAGCQRMSCGDGAVQAPEQCDPPGPGCTQTCRRVRCGDGILQGLEECDPPELDTWCSAQCLRRNPAEACGDGRVDSDLGEECDPPGFASNCGDDCKRPTCGDGRVSGGEQCEQGASRPGECSNCQYAPGRARECHACLAQRCAAPEPEDNLFDACFELDGTARAGAALGQPLSALCREAVECMRRTACAVERNGTSPANPLACYCGKSILTADNADAARRLRECRDGIAPARGACRLAFERAAEAAISPRTGRGLPASVLAAAAGNDGKPALSRAIRLMTECGHAAAACGEACAVVPACGDGVVGIGEACDPEDPDTGERCDDTFCSILPCGNGQLDPGESCDVADEYTNPPGSGRCNSDCQLEAPCGDGRWTAGTEECDGSAPGESWANCCRSSALGPPAAESHVPLCDKNGNGRIDDEESCKFPQLCGNGVQEGTEQCDDGGRTPAPPEVDACDDTCKRIENDPCSVCSREHCAPERGACFENVPVINAACGAVFDCIQTSGCVGGGGEVEPCLCGALGAFECATAERRQGACAPVMTQNSGCAPSDPGCVWQRLLSPEFPLGIATQLAQCQVNFCFDQCVTPSE